ncbi:hypothetical protein C1Y63_02840 [Corynebacterium sp. 13CS0277]|uniref:hypothetical protein n=1 Tax=Corynebacterium sp. 13CS0277 TaxID=2071994 RepID=UPI000D02DE37|nr:hypothetical protein [Corynebacterium sp. 13CS0277]PRQ12028.1 hypothetical protein C1Y63_02840 [Corynebacterium sp. 13CS0277]
MSRHSNGRAQFRVALWPIVTLVVVTALVASVIGWMSLRNSARAEHAATAACSEGNLNLPVYSDARQNVVDQILRAYSSSAPRSGDYCVTAVRVESLAEAAIVISSAPTDALESTITSAQRATATSENRWPVAFWESVVLAAYRPQNFPTWTAAREDAYINSGEPAMIQALAAAVLADGDRAAAEALLKDRRRPAAGLSDAPLAMGETVVDAKATAEIFEDIQVPFRAVRLTPAGSVSEKESRAAATLEDFLRANIAQEPNDATAAVLATAESIYPAAASAESQASNNTTAAPTSAPTPDSAATLAAVVLAPRD